MYCSNYKVTQIMHELGIKNGRGVIDWETKLCEICAFITLANDDKIRGPQTTVEVDESMIFKKKYYRGNLLNIQLKFEWIFGGICREAKQIFMTLVKSRDAKILLDVINERIEMNTTIVSDLWRA